MRIQKASTSSSSKSEAVKSSLISEKNRRYKISRKLVVTNDIHSGYLLVYNLRCGSIRRCSSRFWRALRFENRWGGYVAWRAELKDLIRDKYLVPVDEDEQQATLADKHHLMEEYQYHQLYWSIWPTANCNLGCDYCGQEHADVRLSRKHCDMTVEAIRRRLVAHNFKKLHVSWFGGEPLVGLEVIRYLTPKLYQITKEIGIPYDARIITNGTLLTRSVAEELINHLGIVWMEITLDGPAEVHDKRRFTKSGAGTFDRILLNIKNFFEFRNNNKKKASLTLRCNVDVRNADSAKKLVDNLVQRGLEKELGRITFAAIFPWGKAQGQFHRYKSQKRYSKIQLNLAEYAVQKGFTVGVLPLGNGAGCQAANLDNSLNVLPGGKLYTCGEVPLIPEYEKRPDHQRWWEKGTLEELLKMDEDSIRFSSPWYREIESNKWPCSKCKYLGVCTGECPRQRRDGLEPCPYYIYNLPERMRKYSEFNMKAPQENKTASQKVRQKILSKKRLKRKVKIVAASQRKRKVKQRSLQSV